MPEKHLNGFWIYELDQAVEISSLTIIDSREGKAQRMSVTNSYFHDGLNCGINLRGAQEVLIANSHAERTRTGGVVAMEDYWWGEGGFPGMLPSLLNTAALRALVITGMGCVRLGQVALLACCRPLWSTCNLWPCIYSCTCKMSSREGRQLRDTARPCQYVCRSRACMQQRVKAVSGCGFAAGDVVLRNNTVHHAYYQKDEGAAICAFATGLDDHPSGIYCSPYAPSLM